MEEVLLYDTGAKLVPPLELSSSDNWTSKVYFYYHSVCSSLIHKYKLNKMYNFTSIVNLYTSLWKLEQITLI